MAINPEMNDETRTYVVLAKGTMIGHYRIIERIGAGGMGEVYLAEDVQLTRKVCLKFMPLPYAADGEARARFAREARAAAMLNHPHIVTIHDVGEYKGRPYIVMEHCTGRTLRDYRIGKVLTLEQVYDVAIQIGEGLQAAHAAGVVHRDLKPANIMMDEYGRLKLLDFGLAAVKSGDKVTKTGSTLGTVGYMAPEQIAGKDVDARADLFSLGVILYEMIAGQRPFQGDNDAAILNAVLNDAPQPLARYRADVPEELQRIVTKLLEKKIGFRYQSVVEVVSDLRRLTRSRNLAPTAGLSTQQKLLFVALPFLVVLILVLALSTPLYRSIEDEPDASLPVVAVLPFENLGDVEHEYFADGITDEIISRLAALHGLGVISRTSTLQYKGTTKNLRQIGAELGADYILEGTIRWDKSGEESRVRINPQLIQAADDVHLWAERYDAVIDDIFAVQSSIAEKVIEALGVTLLESERLALREQPTANATAYDYYLRGHKYMTVEEKDLRNAEAMFNRAIELAPDYALAYAELGVTHTQMYWYYYDRTAQRLQAAREAIDRAFAIDPDLPEAHGALGWYYYHGLLDFDQALEEFSVQQKMQPGNSRAIYNIALIERRRGKWDKAVKSFAKAFKLDPRSVKVCSEYGSTLTRLRRYAEAEVFYDRAIDIMPDASNVYLDKSWSFVLWEGETEAARKVVQDALQRTARWPLLTFLEASLDILDGDYERALQRLTSLRKMTVVRVFDSVYSYNMEGDVYRLSNQVELQTAFYDSARVILEGLVARDDEDPWNHAVLSWAYAGLGRRQEAIGEGRRAVELRPVTADALDGVDLNESLAKAYTIVREDDLALEQLELLLSMPSNISVPYLKIWPDYAPLRDHPRFQKLLDEYDTQ